MLSCHCVIALDPQGNAMVKQRDADLEPRAVQRKCERLRTTYRRMAFLRPTDNMQREVRPSSVRSHVTGHVNKKRDQGCRDDSFWDCTTCTGTLPIPGGKSYWVSVPYFCHKNWKLK